MKKHLRLLSAIAILFIIFGTIYGTVQNAQRNEANMPQIQLATEGAASLNKTGNVQTLAQSYIDINTSLDPFVIIYDKNGVPVSGSGYLNGSLPQIPKGVLTNSKGKDYHAVTWAPTKNLRFATIAVYANKDYYVVSARSLKVVEHNENQTQLISLAGLVASLLVLGITYKLLPKQKNPRK